MLICYVCGGETRVMRTKELQTFYVLNLQLSTTKRRREGLGCGLRANTIERWESDPDELERSRLEKLLRRVRSAVDRMAADLDQAGIPPATRRTRPRSGPFVFHRCNTDCQKSDLEDKVDEREHGKMDMPPSAQP